MCNGVCFNELKRFVSDIINVKCRLTNEHNIALEFIVEIVFVLLYCYGYGATINTGYT